MYIGRPMGERRSDDGWSMEVAEALSGGTVVINHILNGFWSDCVCCRGVYVRLLINQRLINPNFMRAKGYYKASDKPLIPFYMQ